MSVEIGLRLRQARESQGISLEALADETRIPVSYLTALEEGQFDHLPSPYYIRSYIRAYAHCVGLDPQILLRELKRWETGKFGAHPDPQRTSRRSRRGGKEPDRSPSPTQTSGTGLTRRARKRGSHSTGEYDAVPPAAPSAPNSEHGSLSRSASHGKKKGFSFLKRKRQNAPSEAAPGLQDPPDHGSGDGPLPDEASASSHRGTPRRPKMPDDLPAPQELGLPAPPERETAEKPSQAPDRETAPVLSRRAATRSFQATVEGGGGRRRGRGKAGKGKDKAKESTLGIWYTRALILGALLLIPAALWLVYLMVYADEGENSRGSDNQAESRQAEQPDESKEPKQDPILTKVESTDSVVHYELTHAERIELKLDASGECWFQIRGQEVGNELKEGILKKGETYSFDHKEGQELWIEFGAPDSVNVKVNGKKMETGGGPKKYHITLLQ